MNRIAILGDGQMGLVMADAFAARGVPVRLWGPTPDKVRALAESRQSPERLPGFRLPPSIEVEEDDERALEGASLIVCAIPTQFIRDVLGRVAPAIKPDAAFVSVAKGIETETLLRPTQIIADALGKDPSRSSRSLCALSGPTIAAELARRLPATMVAASDDAALPGQVQDLLNVPWLRIYRHDDVLGVELAGATKNIIALAAGMVDGLEAGYNAKSALVARGLAEIARLGAAMGARMETFFGVAGVGDLATTCFSPSGRNRGCGERLGRGEPLEAVLSSTVSVVEGIPTTRSVRQLAMERGIEMPITEIVHAILYEDLKPREAIRELMGREPKAERIG